MVVETGAILLGPLYMNEFVRMTASALSTLHIRFHNL